MERITMENIKGSKTYTINDPVLQFYIELKDTEPKIWRRILISSDSSFWDLHSAIQSVFEWKNCHLHQFEYQINKKIKKIGIPEERYLSYKMEIYPSWKKDLNSVFNKMGMIVDYLYDFGDSWLHVVKLEAILPKEKGQKYPVCTGGARKSPPENCGGVTGYEDLLMIINDENHSEYDITVQWIGGKWDPEEFDENNIKFYNSNKLLDMSF